MRLAPTLCVGADAYAGAAVHPVIAPVLEALLRIHVPLERPGTATLRRRLPIGVVLEADGVDLAYLGAALAAPAELGYAEVDRACQVTSGRSVKTLKRRTLGPYSGVMRSPWRPSCPNPASIAIGTLSPTLFPAGTAV